MLLGIQEIPWIFSCIPWLFLCIVALIVAELYSNCGNARLYTRTKPKDGILVKWKSVPCFDCNQQVQDLYQRTMLGFRVYTGAATCKLCLTIQSRDM